MARPSSTLDLPLYADLSFLAQRRRGLLRRAHASTPQARRLPIRRRSESRHQSLRRRDKRRSKTLRLDRRSPPRPRRCETRETSVRVDPLDVKDIPQVGPLQWGWIRTSRWEVCSTTASAIWNRMHRYGIGGEGETGAFKCLTLST